MNRHVLAVVVLILAGRSLAAQTLESLIKEGLSKSYTIQIAQSALKIAEAEYSIFRISTRPTLSINGNAPVYNKDNYGITQPDGTIKFLRRSQNYSNVGFSISQPITFTGGTVSLNTDLYRFDDFVTKTKQYNGTPVFIQLQQPLFGYNKYKWEKQIEPLRLLEARLTFSLEANQLSYEICKGFFDIIEAQTNRSLALSNLSNCRANLSIEKRKKQLGTSVEEKILPLEIEELNNQREAEAAELNLLTAYSRLRLLINTTDTITGDLTLPESLPSIELDLNKLVTIAKRNLPLFITQQKRELEARSKTSHVKSQNNQINIVASFGLTNSGSTIPSVYQNTNDQQRASLGFTIPLLTWGKRRKSIEAALLEEKQAVLSNKAEEARLVNELTGIVKELPLLRKNVQTTLRIDTLTQRRYQISNRLFQSGKTSLLELQAAQNEKDNTRRNYILALRRFWEAWYLLKAKTGLIE